MSKRNQRLKQLLQKDASLLGEVVDAGICNDVAMDLHKLRSHANITQKELADKLGVKQSNISRWEHAGYQGYKIKMLSKIVRNLGGRLRIIIDPPINTSQVFISLEQIKQTEYSKIEMTHPDGWRISAETLKQQELTRVSLQGQGANYATI